MNRRRRSDTELMLGLVMILLAVAFAALMYHIAGSPVDYQNPQQPAIQMLQIPAKVTTVTCPEPAPTTAQGYTDLWASVDPDVWGAADVSLSVKMGERRVWLYGDTMSNGGRFVHSTAITQDAGCLHVSDGGSQLLPDDDASHIYWIYDAAKASDTTITVTARSIHLTGEGGIWGFEDNGFTRTALVRLGDLGNVRFVRWTSKTVSPKPDSGPLYRLDDLFPQHFGYSMNRHSVILANGRNLWTIAQTWDDGQLHGWANHRPLFADRKWTA